MPIRPRTSRGAATAVSATNTKSSLQKTPTKTVATPKKTTYSTQTSTGKRKRNEYPATPASQPASDRKKQGSQEEKRLKTFRKHAPQTFLRKLARAQTQRMIVIGRTRLGAGAELREEIDVVGSTGNIYKVTIARLPHCTCPDHQKGNECKHKVYALHTVLKAPEDLQYQRAFLIPELHEMFSNAPPIPTDVGDNEDKDGKRKPIEGECPICYMDFEEEHNELVWCKAACGNNMHRSCFEQWAASQRGQAVRCVYCRTEWEMDKNDLANVRKAGAIGDDGYINVAEQFGMSEVRDFSTYHQPWVRRQFGTGW